MSKIIANSRFFAQSSDKVYIFSVENPKQVPGVIDYQQNVSKELQKSGTHPVDCFNFSPCGTYLLLTIQKELHLYNGTEYQFINSCAIDKTASCLRFFTKSRIALVADRSGRVSFFSYNNGLLERLPTSFGHNSMLTDALISDNEKFVITSDRDEKIRVTHYPNVHNIQSFCLGHEQFVTSLQFVPSDSSTLISTSGDGTLRLWDWITGKELLTFRDSACSLSIPLAKIICVPGQSSTLIAAQKYEVPEILLLTLTGNKFTEFQIEVKSRIVTPSSVIDMGMLHNTIVYLVESGLYGLSEDQDNESISKDLISSMSENLKSIPLLKPAQTFQILFKREFNNIKEYYERKKARLTEKAQ